MTSLHIRVDMLQCGLKGKFNCLFMSDKSNFIETLREKMFRPTLGSLIVEGTK